MDITAINILLSLLVLLSETFCFAAISLSVTKYFQCFVAAAYRFWPPQCICISRRNTAAFWDCVILEIPMLPLLTASTGIAAGSCYGGLLCIILAH